MAKVYDLNRMRKTYPLVRNTPVLSTCCDDSNSSGVNYENSLWEINEDGDLQISGFLDGIVNTGAFAIDLNNDYLAQLKNNANITMQEVLEAISNTHVYTVSSFPPELIFDKYWEFDDFGNIIPKIIS